MPSYAAGDVFAVILHIFLVELEKRFEEYEKLQKEYKYEVQSLSKMVEEKKVYMTVLHTSMLRTKSKCIIEDQESKFIERTNDDLMGRLVCTKRKNSRQTVEALLSAVTEFLIGVALISERYIRKWASKEVMKLSPQKKSQEREWAGRSEIVSSDGVHAMFVLFPTAPWNILLEEITISLQRKQ